MYVQLKYEEGFKGLLKGQLKSWCKPPPYLPIRPEGTKNNVSN